VIPRFHFEIQGLSAAVILLIAGAVVSGRISLVKFYLKRVLHLPPVALVIVVGALLSLPSRACWPHCRRWCAVLRCVGATRVWRDDQ
jgi:hypothetical protein